MTLPFGDLLGDHLWLKAAHLRSVIGESCRPSLVVVEAMDTKSLCCYYFYLVDNFHPYCLPVALEAETNCCCSYLEDNYQLVGILR